MTTSTVEPLAARSDGGFTNYSSDSPLAARRSYSILCSCSNSSSAPAPVNMVMLIGSWSGLRRALRCFRSPSGLLPKVSASRQRGQEQSADRVSPQVPTALGESRFDPRPLRRRDLGRNRRARR